MKLKVIKPGAEIIELDLSPTDQIAMPLGTTIIGPDHWDAFVATQKDANAGFKTEGEAAVKIAAAFKTTLEADLKKELDKKPIAVAVAPIEEE